MFGFESGKPVFSDKHLNHREQVEPLISLYQDGEASPQEQRTVEFYLERCAECRALYAAFNKIQVDLGEVLATTPTPRLDPGFYRQTPFYQANQRKQIFDNNAQANNRPFVNAVSPVISGGNSGMPRRASFAASFGGLAAAIALLIGVAILLILSINSLNNNNPVPTVAQVASNNDTVAAESPTATTAPASDTPQATEAGSTTTSAKTTTRGGNSTPTPKSSDGSKTTSASSTTTRGQGEATTTTPPAVKTTTRAAVNNTTTVANAVTTPPLNTVAAATTQPNTVATTTSNNTTATTSTTNAATTQNSTTSGGTTLAAATTTTVAPVAATTENPTVTPSFSTPPVENSTPTTAINNNVSAVASPAIVSPTVTPSFPEPTFASDISTTVVAAPTLSATVASSPTITASAAVSTTIAATDTVSATTTAAATTVATTSTTPAVSTAAPTLTATTVPPTTAPALVNAPGLIAYVSTKDGEVHLMHSDGSNDYTLTNGTAANIVWTQLVWSPDARWLAAVGKTRSNGVYSIYTLDTQSTHPDITPVANGIAPAWSPNNRLLAYLANTTLDPSGVRVGNSAVLDLKHSVTTSLDNSYTGFGPQWFPDGQRLLAGQSTIYRITPDATARTFDVTLVQRIKLAFTNTCLATSLSPNGTQLASLENATNGSLLLVYYDLTRSDAPRIPLGIVSGFNNTIRAGHNCGTLRLSWTPSGRSIYFYAQSGNSFYNVLESVSTSEVSYLTNIYAPSFTQDGAYLVDFDPTTNQVYALSSSVNSRPVNVPVIGSAEFAPSWQPVYK